MDAGRGGIADQCAPLSEAAKQDRFQDRAQYLHVHHLGDGLGFWLQAEFKRAGYNSAGTDSNEQENHGQEAGEIFFGDQVHLNFLFHINQ
jgi:hypothetical protein